jgi:hypothetical protein
VTYCVNAVSRYKFRRLAIPAFRIAAIIHDLKTLSITGLTPFTFPLPVPFLDQLIVCQGLDSLGVRDVVHDLLLEAFGTSAVCVVY